MHKYPMTVDGEKSLQEELLQLKSIERPKIIQAIAEARAHGDLSENAEYHAAKEKQSFIEGRIAELEHKLSHAHVIDPKSIECDGKITFGAKVKLFDLESELEVEYQIVGDDEADIKYRKISVHSPVARGLIGREVGNVVEIKTPNGVKEYEILDFVL